MADIVNNNQDRIVLAEIEAGIDFTESDSVEDLNHYWLRNEDGDIVLTHFRGTVTRVWAIDGSDDYSPSGTGGATSLVWEIDGSGDIVPI